MDLEFRNEWTRRGRYRIELRDRSDFAAFYHTFLLRSYSHLQITEGESVLDAGAYIGVWTILASSLVGPRGRVVAVEPDRTNFERLVRNLRRNNVTNVLPVRKTLWSRGGLAIRLDGKSDAVVISERGDQEGVTETIDSLAQTYDVHFNRIKMSISGAEKEALKAATWSIPHCRQLVLEVYGASSLDFVTGFLTEHRFRFRVAPFESLTRAARAFARHPFLVGVVESHNLFRTARRLARKFAAPRRERARPPAEYWLVEATSEPER